MFFFFLFALVPWVKAYEGNAQNDLPFEDESDGQQIPAEEQQIDDDQEPQIEDEDEAVEAPPKEELNKTVAKVKIPFKDIVSFREVIVLGVFIIYVIFYIVGKVLTSSLRKEIETKLFKYMGDKYWAVVPPTFQVDNLHNAKYYCTGRSLYKGCYIKLSQKPKADPLGLVYGIVTGAKDKIVFELILKPKSDLHAVFRVQTKKPEDYDKLYLKENPIENSSHLKVYTDLGDEKAPFVERINQFLENHPHSLVSIDLSDFNIYETRDESPYIARFEFELGSDKSLLGEELVDFIMGLADDFVSINMSPKTATKNKHIREKIASEKRKEEYKKKEEEKKPEKLTLEQQIARDKKDKKGKRKDSPKIKTIKK